MRVILAPDVPLVRDHLRHVLARPCARASAWPWCRRFVDPEAELGVDVRGRREIFRSAKLPFVDPSVRES